MVLRWALVVLALGLMAGCGGGVDDEGGRPAPPTYDTWAPVYSDVRPATTDDLEELFARARASVEGEWTAHLDGLTIAEHRAPDPDLALLEADIEMASTGNHLRFRFSSTEEGELEYHLAPPMVITRCDDAACRELAQTDTDDPYILWLMSLVRVQRTAFPLDESQPVPVKGELFAHVESPMGRLDCIVLGLEGKGAADIEGDAVSLAPRFGVDGGEPIARCLDVNGLAVLPANAMLPVLRFTSYEEGVDGDVTAFPFPVKRP